MSEQFEAGDVVQLKSGGERMTIEAIDEDGYVSCVWFEGKQPQRGAFAAATLQKAGPSSAIFSTIRA